MAVCTFFGHRDCIGLSRQRLEEAIEDLICNHGVDSFYVGNEGQFDALVHWVNTPGADEHADRTRCA